MMQLNRIRIFNRRKVDSFPLNKLYFTKKKEKTEKKEKRKAVCQAGFGMVSRFLTIFFNTI
jgi:hypothetical protein